MPLKDWTRSPSLVCSLSGLGVPMLSRSARGTGWTVQSSSSHGPRSQKGARPLPGCGESLGSRLLKPRPLLSRWTSWVPTLKELQRHPGPGQGAERPGVGDAGYHQRERRRSSWRSTGCKWFAQCPRRSRWQKASVAPASCFQTPSQRSTLPVGEATPRGSAGPPVCCPGPCPQPLATQGHPSG